TQYKLATGSCPTFLFSSFSSPLQLNIQTKPRISHTKMSPTMKAIVVEEFGGPEKLLFKDVEKPKSKDGFVLIRIKAFGVNHAELHMRKGEWPESMPIIGIECVGIVEACPGGEFKPGT